MHPASVDGDVAIPKTLHDPIDLEHDGHEASFRLLGASGSRDTDDSVASFDDAMTGVDVAYNARPTGVEEALTLANSSAPQVFVYDLTAGSSYSAAVEDGAVVLRDGSGTARYSISAPLAWDSAPDPAFTNALTLSVTKVLMATGTSRCAQAAHG